MRYYRPSMVNKYQVFKNGTVVLPEDKQSALYLLALEVGHWCDPVTDVNSYENTILQIFSDLQQPYIRLKLTEYHTMGFSQWQNEDLCLLAEDLAFSTGQDMAWFDFLLVMSDYESLCQGQTSG